MRFRPRIDFRGQSFREFHRAEGVSIRAWTADRLVGTLSAGVGHVSNPPIDEPAFERSFFPGDLTLINVAYARCGSRSVPRHAQGMIRKNGNRLHLRA
jgi:hypothetical protein